MKDDKKSSADPSEYKDGERRNSFESEEVESESESESEDESEDEPPVYAKSNAMKGQSLISHNKLNCSFMFAEQIQSKGSKQDDKGKKPLTKYSYYPDNHVPAY